MSTKVTMSDTAYTYLSKQVSEVTFAQLWQAVSTEMGIPADQLSRKKRRFYSELMEDRRFAALSDNMWDLRSRRKFNEVSSSIELEDDSDEETEEYEETEGTGLSAREDDYN